MEDERFPDDLTKINPLTRKKNKIGLTPMQDGFARLCAVYPAGEITNELARDIYRQLPTVEGHAERGEDGRNSWFLLHNPKVIAGIEHYRQINERIMERKAVQPRQPEPIKEISGFKVGDKPQVVPEEAEFTEEEVEDILNSERVKEGLAIIAGEIVKVNAKNN